MTGRVGLVGTKLGIGGTPSPVGIGRLGSTMRCKSGGGAVVIVGMTGRLGIVTGGVGGETGIRGRLGSTICSRSGGKTAAGGSGGGMILGPTFGSITGMGGATGGGGVTGITGRLGPDTGCRFGGGGGGSG